MCSQILKISVLLFFLCFASLAQAANPFDIIINEIAWMGTEASYNNEWIELKNNTNQKINLEGWILKAADGSPEIKLTGNIPANGFYLLERTNDNTIIDIPADQIYVGALSNRGERLELYDSLGNLIDYVAASSGWPAGSNQTKQTMERLQKPVLRNLHNNWQWQTSKAPGGTPKAENSPGEVPKQSKTSPPASEQTNTAFSSRPGTQKQSPSLIIFLSAALTAVFSSTAIFFLKKGLS